MKTRNILESKQLKLQMDIFKKIHTVSFTANLKKTIEQLTKLQQYK